MHATKRNLTLEMPSTKRQAVVQASPGTGHPAPLHGGQAEVRSSHAWGGGNANIAPMYAAFPATTQSAQPMQAAHIVDTPVIPPENYYPQPDMHPLPHAAPVAGVHHRFLSV